MIVSHRHGFIFLKTRKTAGTSVELALRRLLGPKDVATPLSREEERFALKRGIPGPRNHLRIPRDLAIERLPNLIQSVNHALRTGKSLPRLPIFDPYRQHLNAHKVQAKVGQKIWDSYFKFTIERNPWERTVSYYHWICRNETDPPPFSDFVASGRDYPLETNYAIYSIKGIPVADYWARYETLVEDLNYLSRHLALPILIGDKTKHIWAKSQWRQRAPYTEYYDAATRRIVGLQFAAEIQLMGYTFD